MKTLLLTLLALPVMADRVLTIAWNPQTDADSFRIYVDGSTVVDVPSTATPSATVSIPEGKCTVTVSARNAGGESLQSAPLTIPASPANPKGITIKEIRRTTISTP
jgi:hypothetical protein